MDRPDEGPPAKARRLSSSEPPQDDVPPPPPPPPPPLLRLPLPPPEQRPRPQEETEAAQVLADMRGVGLGPTLPVPPPFLILEEGGIRAYFTLGAGCSCWESQIESGFGGALPPSESLETLPPAEVSGENVQINIQVAEPSSFDEEKALETCSIGGREYQMLADLQGKEEAIILVEDDVVDAKESVRKRRRRKRRQRKAKKESRVLSAEKKEYILQALEDIQVDLEAVNLKAGRAFLRLKRKFIQMRRPFLERRDLIIQRIPGFWVKAFLNHPKISILINQRDEDIFRYLTNLQVQDLRHISMGYKMKLYFQTNPYFTNMVIVKEFQCNRMGRLVSHSTPIRWHRGQEPQAHRHKNQDTRPSFFSWFSNHSHPEADRIAEIIKNDLWVNPVRYYRMGEGGYRTKGKKRGKKDRLFHSKKRDKYEMVIMEDFDDYQIMKEIIGETSDSDVITDNDTLYDVKISDFMETTDCFETTDNEITDIGESLFDNEIPGHHETTYNNESADDSDDNTGGDNKNPKGCSYSNILDMCDSDNDGDNEASDDDDDSNVGDNEGSDDGNEGDNEGSDDDDRDIKGPRKHQVNSNLDGYKVKNIFEEESSVDEEEGNEEGGEDSYEEEIDDWEDSDMEDAFLVQNTSWTSWGKRG